MPNSDLNAAISLLRTRITPNKLAEYDDSAIEKIIRKKGFVPQKRTEDSSHPTSFYELLNYVSVAAKVAYFVVLLAKTIKPTREEVIKHLEQDSPELLKAAADVIDAIIDLLIA